MDLTGKEINVVRRKSKAFEVLKRLLILVSNIQNFGIQKKLYSHSEYIQGSQNYFNNFS